MFATPARNRRVPLRRLSPLLLVAIVACATATRQTANGPVAYPLPAPLPRPSESWPLPPLQAEAVMRSRDLRMVSPEDAGGGVTGASKVELRAPGIDGELHAKWKKAPRGLDSWNNSPRRELAAYAVQKLFLDPEDFVVPPSVMRCVPTEEYRAVFGSSAEPTVPGSDCVLGNLSLWMENVTVPDDLYDEDRFATDSNYAARLADFNLLTFIIDHKDGRRGNFLVSKDEADRRVFAIDNGISFDARIFNYFVRNWNDLRVPALRKRSVDRLRAVTREQIEALAVNAELHVDDEGVLRLVEHGTPLSDTKGARRREGIVQLGLTADEVDDVREQIREVIDAVDKGEMPVF
jgi:hypothetical protein